MFGNRGSGPSGEKLQHVDDRDKHLSESPNCQGQANAYSTSISTLGKTSITTASSATLQIHPPASSIAVNFDSDSSYDSDENDVDDHIYSPGIHDRPGAAMSPANSFGDRGISSRVEDLSTEHRANGSSIPNLRLSLHKGLETDSKRQRVSDSDLQQARERKLELPDLRQYWRRPQPADWLYVKSTSKEMGKTV